MPTRVIVGCPVRRREWIIENWVKSVAIATRFAEVEPHVMIVGGQTDPTIALAGEAALAVGLRLTWLDSGELVRPHAPAGRATPYIDHWWNGERIERMVDLRNALLHSVRTHRPDYFLSLDSDVLLHEAALVGLLELLGSRSHAAAGGKTFMSPFGTHAPSFSNVEADGLLSRHDSGDVLDVDIIMAIKLMKPEAYAVDYEYDRRGEDVGWSLACKRRGLSFVWDGRTTSRHVMRRP